MLKVLVSCTALVALLLTGIGNALAEDTVGAILDGGGKKLTAEEFNAEVTGRSVSGTASHGPYRHEFREGGKLGGSVTGSQGTGAIVGTWKVDDNGQVCLDYSYGVRKYPGKSCAYYFKSGDQYYVSKSDSEKGAPAAPIKVAR